VRAGFALLHPQGLAVRFSTPTAVSWGVLSLAAALLLWLGLPFQPPIDRNWPSPGPAAETAMATTLAHGVGNAWKAGEKQKAWEQAEILLSAYPNQPLAKQVSVSKGRLQAAAQEEQWAKRWAYQTLEGASWGRISQAQIESEPMSFSPDVPLSSLIIRTGNLSQYQAAFFVPGMALPAECSSAAGCVLLVSHGAETTPIRLFAKEDGLFQFTDPQRLLGWLAARQEIAVAVEQKEAIKFETRGLDLPRMRLP